MPQGARRAAGGEAPVKRKAKAKRAESDGSEQVRVWAEAGVTLAVTSDPPQFVRLTYGHERIAPDSSEATLKEYEKKVFDHCEAVVQRRAKRLVKLVRRTQAGR